ncbi:MAG: hypothetical protein KBS81_06785, partial [Spirochaetales bacterium]|nr:hypothetical protein [Candidatus Physcosoma equi]
MKRITLALYILLVLLLASCSSPELQLCEIGLGITDPKTLDPATTHATPISTSIVSSSNENVIGQSISYFVQITKTDPAQFCSLPAQNEADWPKTTEGTPVFTAADGWIHIDPTKTSNLVLSQGIWEFKAVAYLREDYTTTTEDKGDVIITLHTRYSAKLMETIGTDRHYVNLNTKTISISAEPIQANATVTFAYTTSPGYEVETYLTQDLANWGAPTGSSVTVPSGTYYVKAIIKDSSTKLPVGFGDIASVYILPTVSQRINGRFDTSGKIGISEQNGSHSGLEEALENFNPGDELILSGSFDVSGLT